ncbi:MAG: hypothetical protein EXX96DRAFT_622086 [Benjaminiella poitrasii]|nr:MAG: hypothetical protein EXX96DRAFT_622086 [Benjaminiella poitrasii]
MAYIVSSNSSPSLLDSSLDKEEIIKIDRNSSSNSSLIRHYSLIALAFLAEDDDLLKKSSLPALYFNEQKPEEDTEEDTEDDESSNSNCLSSVDTQCGAPIPKDTVGIPRKPDLMKKAPLCPSSTTTISSLDTLSDLVQGYSPQLNLNLHSPSPSKVSSIKSLNNNGNNSCQSLMSAVETQHIKPNGNNNHTLLNPTTHPIAETLVHTSINHKLLSYPSKSPTASVTNAATINSAVQPNKVIDNTISSHQSSTSRFINALQKLKDAQTDVHIGQQNSLRSQQTILTLPNTVVPAELIESSFSLKPSHSKSSLAGKIKNRFQQLNKHNNRTSLMRAEPPRKRPLSSFTMPRSSSLSSIAHWSSLITGHHPKPSILKNKPWEAIDEATCLPPPPLTSNAALISSLSASISNTYPFLSGNPEEKTKKSSVLSTAAFSLTKSISSHQLYRKSSQLSLKQPTPNMHHALPTVNRNSHSRTNRSLSSSRISYNTVAARKQEPAMNICRRHNSVRFTKLVSVRETYSKTDYDRGSDPNAVCSRLTPEIAQQIKEELNCYKLHEMQVHEYKMPHRSNSSASFFSENNADKMQNEFKVQKRESTCFASFWKIQNSFYLVLTTLIEAIAIIILESILFAKFKQSVPPNIDIWDGLTKGIPVYLMLFIFSQVFQVALACDAVYNKNTIQIIAFILFNLCCFGYAVFQFKQVAEALKQQLGEAPPLVWSLQKLMIANPVIIGVCQLIYFYLGARLYLEFGWRIYKKIGADPDIRNMYRWYQIFLTVLKLDIFFFLGFSIQYLVLVLQKSDAEYPLTIVALPATCIVLVLAVYAVRHESRSLITLFFVGLTAGIAYFIFKIYRIYDKSQQEKYEYVKEVLTFFACVTLVLLVLTIIIAAICWSNFGKGLKRHFARKLDDLNDMSQVDGSRTLSLD